MKRRLKNIIDTKTKKKGAIVFFLLTLIMVGITLILGINVNNKSSIAAKKTFEENSVNENNKIIYENTMPADMAESFPIENSMSHTDEFIKDSMEASYDNNVINNMAGAPKSDFIRNIEDSTSDDDFNIKFDAASDPQFIIQAK